MSLDKYAQLIVHNGLNIQKNQILIIRSQINTADFARKCMKMAYEAGAKDVFIHWIDDECTRIRYTYSALENFENVEPWLLPLYNDTVMEDTAYLVIDAGDPENLKGIDSAKSTAANKASRHALKPFYNRLDANKNVWCVVSMPSPSWAKKVFPALEEAEAIEALTNAILKATRADQGDPVKAWDEHQKQLDFYLDKLNGYNFKTLRYKNNIGSDFTVDLAPNHIWYGGADTHTLKGYKFIANIPTEEVYTAPDRNGINGKVVSTMPLEYHNQVIEDFWLLFENGVVVDYDAKVNKEVLTEIFNSDPNANRIGEVALVPYDSPISNQNILYYKTLFDENASCHLALGSAYPICITDGEDMDEETLEANHLNVSITHVDFMVGSNDLSVTGILEDGTEIPVFRDGNFAFQLS